jgi:hypothetical protein
MLWRGLLWVCALWSLCGRCLGQVPTLDEMSGKWVSYAAASGLRDLPSLSNGVGR